MRAIVSEVKYDGLVLLLVEAGKNRREVWLPAAEWSKNSSEWETARQALDVYQEVDVVSTSRFYEDRLVVSRKGVDGKTVIDASTSGILVRDMKIVDVARRLVRGTIGYETPAVINHQSYEKYLDWVSSKDLSHDLSDHAVLGKGDVIRAFIKGIDHNDEPPSVILNLGEYLDFRNDEITRIVMTPEPAINDDYEEYVPRQTKIRAEDISKISPVLLVDDDECRNPIANILKHEGVEVHTLETSKQAEEFLSSISAGESLRITGVPFRLAILDPNLEDRGSDLIGLRIAAELRAKTDCRVIIMTGEVKNTIKLAQWPNLGIHGYIEKPFTMDQLIGEIEDAVGLAKDLPLYQWIKTDSRDSSAGKDSGVGPETHGASEITVSEALQPLGKLRQGIVLHVFELHPRSFRARSLGSFSGASLKWESLRGKIAKSVIKDTAVGGSLILDLNADQNQEKHLWTLEMMKYHSFCGLPIQVKGKRVALVAFHPDRNAFDGTFISAARVIAERVGRIIERQTLYHSRRNEAELASFGMALAALAHELASDMTALNANLKLLGDIASNSSEDTSDKDEALLTLSRIRGNVDVITRKTKILRGTHVLSDRVSITDCLKKAAKTCRTVIGETMKHPERILIKDVNVPDGEWNVNASEASLIIVFFNLYLNAAQQIELTSSVRRYGLIWNSLTRSKDAKGKAWARVRIHDTGPGIHHDDWEPVFEPGFSTKPDGSGLGLYICRYLLKECFGSVAVTSSAIWDGTTVTVNLPLAD